ncbi:MAG TPA: phosphoglucosamine mutase [Actinomycetota bacterium]|nr:phosphoglucosamine mutase [Actinomycetota bacterium]
MTERLFGTDGVRGLAGTELTEDIAYRLGRAGVLVLGRQVEGRPTFVVGRDPRASGEWLEDALVEGIREGGGDAFIAGIEPTPAIAFLTTDLGATSGVVISASHNPPEYNGIKFFDATGSKLPDDVEDEIEGAMDDLGAAPDRRGDTRAVGDGRERYLTHLVDAAEARLDGMRIAIDCANGSASEVAPALLRRLGAEVHAINAEPDGKNINDGCGALYPEVVAQEVVRVRADAGVSHDGDADRALFADAEGAIVDGDQVLAATAIALLDAGRLRGNTVVTTVMANLGFHHAMREAGIDVVSSRVGDRYVLEDMVRTGAVLGGEQSGHVIFRDRASTGDGLLTAVRFLSLAAATGRTVRELASVMRRYPQRMINVDVADRSVAQADDVRRAVAEAEASLGLEGRVLVRASGTEPLVRVMVEAETEDLATEHADRIADVVRAASG